MAQSEVEVPTNDVAESDAVQGSTDSAEQPEQDRTGESDPETGDDANPDSVVPEASY